MDVNYYYEEPLSRDVYESEFGTVHLTQNVTAYMHGLNPDWRSIVSNKRRGKGYKRLREEWLKIERAIKTLSRVYYVSGGMLKAL